MKYPGFEYVEKRIRKRSFGIIGTVDSKNRPHTTGVLYGVAPREYPFMIYVLTGAKYKKTRNLRRNPNVSFVIPFPHHWLRFIPDYVVQFQGSARIVPLDHEIAVAAFQDKWILRGNIDMAEKLQNPETGEEAVFIEIRPNKKIHVFGLGISMRTMLSDVEQGAYTVEIPDDRWASPVVPQ